MEPEKKQSILLVEDEMLIAMEKQMSLQKYGYTVSIANSGEKAVAMVKEPISIDLILMDIDLGNGKMDGTESAGIILKDHDIPIVFHSSHSEREIVEKTEKITSYGYVVKSSSVTVLDASIKMAFKLFEAKANERRASDELEHSRNFLNEIINSTEDMVWAVDSNDFRLTSFNEQLRKYFKKNRNIDIYVGMPQSELFDSPQYLDYWKEHYEKAIRHGTYSEEYKVSVGSNILQLTFNQLKHKQDIVGVTVFGKDITKQKNQEIAMRSSESSLNKAQHVAHIGSWRWHIDTNLLEWSDEMYRIFGIKKASFTGSLPDVVERAIHPDDRAKVDASNLSVSRDGKPIPLEYRIVWQDGTIRTVWAEAGELILDDDGKPNILTGIVQDITQRKKDEEEQNIRDRKTQIMFDTMTEGIALNEMIFSDDGIMVDFRILTVNRAFFDAADFNNDVDTVIGETATELYGMTEKEITDFWLENRNNKATTITEYVSPKSKKTYMVSRSPFYNGMFTTSFIDISKNKKLEADMHEYDERFRLAMDSTSDGIWDCEFVSGEVYNSPSYWKMLGYDVGETKRTLDEWKEYIHPDDQEYAISVNDECRENKRDNFDIEFRMKTRSNTWKWIRSRGKAIKRDSTGKATRMIGTHVDITERKEIENDILAYKNRLEQIMKAAMIIWWEFDVDTTEILFDTRVIGMFGYPIDKFKTLSDFLAVILPSDIELLTKGIETLMTGKSELYELECKAKTQEYGYKWFYIIGSLLKGENKPSSRLTGIIMDIDIRKRQEIEIHALLAQRELTLKEIHHRVKNNMNTLKSLVSLQLDRLKDKSAIDALADVNRRFESMLVLYERLYESENFSSLSIRQYVPSLVDEIVETFPNHVSIKVNTDMADIIMQAKPLQALGIMVNELITNIMKYAFTGKESGLITVSATYSGGHVVFSIQDNGVGMPEGIDFGNSSGFGLVLIEQLTKQLDGDIRIERGNGTKIVLEFDV